MDGKSTLKHAVNILATVLLSAVALLFTAYALLFRSTDYIRLHLTALVGATSAVCAGLAITGILLYVFEKKSAYRLLLCVLVCLDLAAVTFYALCATGIIVKINSISALREYIAQFGKMAAALYIVFSFLQVVILPVPGSVSVAAGVALFGPFLCMIYSFIGITLGSIAAFAIGRGVGYKTVSWIIGKDDLDKWLKKLKGKDYLILSIMFLLPLFPDDILCFVSGLSSMTWKYFIIMIIITRAISVASTAYSFGLIPFNTWWGILIWALIAALIVLAFYLVVKYSDRIDSFIKSKLNLKR